MALPDVPSPDALRRDLVRRLRPTCADFAPAEFEALVDRIVRTELKYRLPGTPAGAPIATSGAADRPLADMRPSGGR